MDTDTFRLPLSPHAAPASQATRSTSAAAHPSLRSFHACRAGASAAAAARAFRALPQMHGYELPTQDTRKTFQRSLSCWPCLTFPVTQMHFFVLFQQNLPNGTSQHPSAHHRDRCSSRSSTPNRAFHASHSSALSTPVRSIGVFALPSARSASLHGMPSGALSIHFTLCASLPFPPALRCSVRSRLHAAPSSSLPSSILVCT